MEWSEALTVLEQVKNRYQAFEKLMDVAQLLTAKDQLIAEREAALDALDEKAGRLTALIAEREVEILGLDSQLTQAREAARADLKRLESSMQTAQRAHQARLSNLDKERQAEQKAHEAVAVQEQERIAALRATVADLQAQEQTIRARLAEFKQQLAGL